jgi:predicted signal transduction protein with EAL and GGDEF domain
MIAEVPQGGIVWFLEDDVAMYRARRRGEAGAYATSEPSMHAAVVERLEIEADLRRAIERDELVLHYQPIIELASGRGALGAKSRGRRSPPLAGDGFTAASLDRA